MVNWVLACFDARDVVLPMRRRCGGVPDFGRAPCERSNSARFCAVIRHFCLKSVRVRNTWAGLCQNYFVDVDRESSLRSDNEGIGIQCHLDGIIGNTYCKSFPPWERLCSLD